MASGGKLERGSSSRKGGSTLQKIAQKKEQLKLYPRIKKVERIATHLHCEVGSYWKVAIEGVTPIGAACVHNCDRGQDI